MKSKPTWAPSSRTSPLDASTLCGMNVGDTVTSTWYGTVARVTDLGQPARREACAGRPRPRARSRAACRPRRQGRCGRSRRPSGRRRRLPAVRRRPSRSRASRRSPARTARTWRARAHPAVRIDAGLRVPEAGRRLDPPELHPAARLADLLADDLDAVAGHDPAHAWVGARSCRPACRGPARATAAAPCRRGSRSCRSRSSRTRAARSGSCPCRAAGRGRASARRPVA